MTLPEFMLVSHLIYILDRECVRGGREGPWLSRISESIYVLLPSGKIVITNSWTAGIHARDAAWEGVEPSPEVIDYCHGIRPAILPTYSQVDRPAIPTVWTDSP